MTGIAIDFSLNYRPIQEIPGGLPLPNFGIFTEFNLSAITPYIFTAITLALLGAIDSLLTSVVADNMTKTKHRPNKELIEQGIGNTIGSLFGGIPGAGGKTKLSGMIAGVFLLVILLALGPIASQIPVAVLAGILITVGIGVMDYKGLKAIPHMPKPEVTILLIVLVLSSVWNLVYAVGVGLIIASLTFMKTIGDLTSKSSNVKPLIKEKSWPDEVSFPENLKEKVFIKHIEGPLFFGSTSDFQQLSKQIPNTASTVIIRMDKVPYMDQSGLFAMEDVLVDVLVDLMDNNKDVLLVGITAQPKYMMERIDIISKLIKDDHIFSNFKECLVWINNNIKTPN